MNALVLRGNEFSGCIPKSLQDLLAEMNSRPEIGVVYDLAELGLPSCSATDTPTATSIDGDERITVAAGAVDRGLPAILVMPLAQVGRMRKAQIGLPRPPELQWLVARGS